MTVESSPRDRWPEELTRLVSSFGEDIMLATLWSNYQRATQSNAKYLDRIEALEAKVKTLKPPSDIDWFPGKAQP